MRLSEKGYLKIGNSIAGWVENGILKVTFDPNKIDFESDDFKNGVILTVEEASNVWDSLVNLVSYVESIDGGMSDLVRDGQRNIDLIRKRIKEAESQNG